jgi:hypothetical protein
MIAVVATVMGRPYTYERVLADFELYPRINGDVSYQAWWETYLRDCGFSNEYHALSEMHHLVQTGLTVGIILLAPVTGKAGHVVAVDECGLINPSTGWPQRIPSLRELLDECYRLGLEYRQEPDFLAVSLPQTPRSP